MALVLTEGFDHDDSGTLLGLKGWTANHVNASSGRFGGGAILCSGSSFSGTLSKTLPSLATLYAGFAFKAGALTSSLDWVVLKAGATSAFRIGVNASAKLQIANSAGTVIATGTTTLLLNTWNYVEVKPFINGASGTCELHLNGVSEIASTVGNFGSSNIDSILLQSPSSSTGTAPIYDDIYVFDSTGSVNNNFAGDVRVVTVYPVGAGAHTQWQANGAASNWQCVDESTPDDDTTYVSDANPGDIDTYDFTSIDGGASIFGLQVNIYARKDDANTRQIAPVVRQGGTDHVGSTVTLGSSYQFYSQIYDQDPTAAQWTAANVNADEFGVKEIA